MSAVPDLYRTANRASLAELGRAARPIEGRDDDYDELLTLVADRRVGPADGDADHRIRQGGHGEREGIVPA